ncbi:hypothetical protein TNIN_388881 [Trichonephila inaurata madagascariensis]|uniref:Uncharacterized protein n=1 Tax=Trichonephila inaurata madagascariensis TaxID=2747483 RepID=A0A8X6XJL1_9ARAC|nr:hypothetical protein TNIN_388881 [Trichonephila inaurata madagascariensis]
MENFNLLDVFEGLTTARKKLRESLDVIKCHSKIYELLDWSAEDLSELFDDTFSPDLICSLLHDHFFEADYFFSMIERATDKLKGFVDHPDLRPSALYELSNLKANYEVVQDDLSLYLSLINIRYKLYIITGI